MDPKIAVTVKHVDKSYKKNKILDNLSMTVEKGIIYGLLGASGCGKTTLLGCIIGRKITDRGEIQVFGKKPGLKGSGVPGSNIGYMPQDIALVTEYTVKETVYFFGRIAGMEDNAIYKRFNELTELLDLPLSHKFISECSGGEQRRVSLAAAIVHEPQLLILDEPTVGVDSLLRDKIWNYFLHLVRVQGKSILMTTHYIEECKDANRIGFMRSGKLLAEDSPSNILAFYQTETLEQAFFKMCFKDNQEHLEGLIDKHEEPRIDRPSTSSSVQSLETDYGSSKNLIQNSYKKSRTFLGIHVKTMRALLEKNWKQFYRNIFGLILFGVIPLSQTVFFIYAIGGDIKGLKLGIINDELPLSECQNYKKDMTALPNDTTYECTFVNISCRFLDYLEHPMISKVYYNTLAEATDGILHGKNLGVIYIGPNFTESYQERIKDIISVDQSTLDFGEIKVYLDMSNRQTGGSLKFKLVELFLDFQKDLFLDCDWNSRLGDKPVREEYLYGKKSDTMLIFMLPALLITCSFFFGSIMTSHIIVSEKCEGVWERCLAVGVSTAEITLGHILMQGLLSLFQSIGPIIISLYLCGIEYQGRAIDMFVVNSLQGICGLCFGFLISIESKNHSHAHILINFAVNTSMFLSGFLWPIEALPSGLDFIAKSLPFTMAINSLRNIIRKGWSLWETQIIYSNLIAIAWIVFFVAFSLVRMKKFR